MPIRRKVNNITPAKYLISVDGKQTDKGTFANETYCMMTIEYYTCIYYCMMYKALTCTK